MVYPFDLTKISNQLTGALNFINTYTRNTFPLFFSTQYLAPNSFHSVAGRLGYFPANMGTSEAASILGIAFFKAFEATSNQGWKTLGLNTTEAFAGHFFLDNIFTTNNQGINTPLVRNHWLVICYGSVPTEGDQNGNDPFNFGTFASHTFTNGIAQLPSDLSKFYKAYNGILHYKNIFAPLRSGTEYQIDYYVRQGYKVFANGTTQITAEPNGRVKLISNFSGSLDCVYVRTNGSALTSGNAVLTGLNMAEPYPIFFKCKEGAREYTSCATDTVWWSYEMFDYAFKHTGLSKYSNAREITKWNAIKYIINRLSETYYIKKEISDNPLRYPGSYALQFCVDVSGNSQTLPGFTITRETGSGKVNFVKLVINANTNVNHFSGVELQNFVTQTLFDPLVSITLEAASNITQVLEVKLSLSPNALDFTQEYKGHLLVTGNSNILVKTLGYKSFLKFPVSNVWNVFSAESPLFVYNSATWNYLQETVLGIDTVIVRMVMPTSSDGGGLINATYFNQIPNIYYSLSGTCQIRFKDSSNNYYYATLGDTGGSWLNFSSSWESLGTNTRQLTEIVFQNSGTTQAEIKLFYVGSPPEFLPVPSIVYKASVTTKSRLAHTLWVGDFKPNNNSFDRKKYKPGVIDFVLNTLNNAESGFLGEQYYCGYQSAYITNKWGLVNEARNVIKLWNDAQESFRNQSIDKITAFLHQVFLPYSPENIPYLAKKTTTRRVIRFPIPMINQGAQQVPSDSYQYDAFSWQGLDPNTGWINYNNRAMEDLARYFLGNRNDAQARKILVNYINWIYEYYQANPNTVITDLKPNLAPQANYSEPHAAAIEGITFLFANMANVEVEKTNWLIQNRFNYIDTQYVSSGAMLGSWSAGQPTFIDIGTTYREYFSFWHGKVIEFYSECLLYKDFLNSSLVSNIPVFPGILEISASTVWQTDDVNGYSFIASNTELFNSDTVNGYSIITDDLDYFIVNSTTDYSINTEYSGIASSLPCNSFTHYITNITEPEYPKLEQRLSAGNKQVVLLSDNPVGKKISLRFENLNADKTAQFTNFYLLVNNEYNGQFIFDVAKITYDDFDGTWVFDSVPNVSTNLGNANYANFNIEFTIKQISQDI